MWQSEKLGEVIGLMSELQRETVRSLLWGEEPDDEGLAKRYGTTTLVIRRERLLAYRLIREAAQDSRRNPGL